MSGKILKTRVEEEGEEPWPGKSSSDGESIDSFGERKLFLVASFFFSLLQRVVKISLSVSLFGIVKFGSLNDLCQ